MNLLRHAAVFGILAAVCVASAQLPLPPGTEVILKFDQPVSSRHAKAGDRIRLEIADTVVREGHPVLTAGTPVMGVIERVDKSDHFGKNARIRLVLEPVNGINLAPRDKGKPFVGASTDHAAEAAGAGALIFGPLGLAAGYFVTGKSVNIHPGDHLRTEVITPA